MPLGILTQAVREGRLRLTDTRADHPVLRLQHAKEQAGLVDTHLGLHGQQLDRMLDLLDQATAQGEDYRLYLAGEILALFAASRYSTAEVAAIRARVRAAIGQD